MQDGPMGVKMGEIKVDIREEMGGRVMVFDSGEGRARKRVVLQGLRCW